MGNADRGREPRHSQFAIRHSSFAAHYSQFTIHYSVLLFLVLTVVWVWPLPARLTSRIASDAGDPVFVTWVLWWHTQALPLTERWWSPPFFFPLPGSLALSEHLLGLAVFAAPLQFAGLNAIGAYNVTFILSFWLSGIFAFLLARRLTGSAAAGIVAGCAFAFAPYRASQLTHLQVLTSYWMALALYAMHAYLDERRPRWLALFAAAWLLQALSNLYFLMFFPVLVGAWLLWFVRWWREPRPGLILLATFALSSLLLLPVLWKYYVVHQQLGLGRRVDEMLHFSADPAAFSRMSDLLAFWPYVKGDHGEHFLFPGVTMPIVVIVAALLAFRRRRGAVARRSPLLFYTAATLLMSWLALGPAPLDQPLQAIAKPYTWLAWLPGFNGLRVPARFAMLGALTLSTAGALAMVRLLPGQRIARGVIAMLIFAGLTVDGWIEALPLAAPIPRAQLPDAAGAIVLELPIDQPQVGTTAMFRMMQHGRPLVNGYSGHTPPQLHILTLALQRDDGSGILAFAEDQPLIVVVHSRFDETRWYQQFVASLDGARPAGVSAPGPVYLFPARLSDPPRPLGAAIEVAAVHFGERNHVTLDLGAPHIVRGLSFPVRERFHRVDPRIEVEASLDKVTWTRAWFGGTAGPAIRGVFEQPREIPFRIQFADVQARYLRIHPLYDWIVKELTISAAPN